MLTVIISLLSLSAIHLYGSSSFSPPSLSLPLPSILFLPFQLLHASVVHMGLFLPFIFTYSVHSAGYAVNSLSALIAVRLNNQEQPLSSVCSGDEQ